MRRVCLSPQICCAIHRSEEEPVTQESSLQLEKINPHRIEEDITEDGILCSILSSLTLTEAVRASVLSPRWRSLWTHLTKFNFDAVNVLDAHTLRGRSPSSAEAYKLTVGNTANFICSVDSLTQKLQGVRLDEFAVSSLPKVSSRLIHLTHLDLQWNADVEMSLLHLTSLLDVAPFLHEFKLCLSKQVEEQLPQTPNMSEEMLSKHPHKHLKRIEVGGFYFDSWQIEIAVYLLDNASELESMTIQKGRESSWLVTKEINETQLKNLCHKFPINVELVISNSP